MKINDYTHEERQTALDEAHAIMNPVEGMEMWREIKDYEHHYEISDCGKIKIKRDGNTLNPADNGNGYLVVNLSKNNVQKKFFVHRLLATHFLDNEHNKRCVNHKDGNKKNNNLKNLEWVTHKENHSHARKNELTISEKPVRQILRCTGEEVSRFKSLTHAYESTGIHISNISRACKKDKGTAGGFRWEYLNR